MRLLKQNDTSKVIVFLLVSSTDHISAVTGASPTVTISKNGGSFASPSGTVTEIGNGWYKLTPASADVSTLGPLLIHAEATNADPVDLEYQVVAYDLYDTLSMGMKYLQYMILGSGQVVSDASNTSQQFKTDLTGSAAHYRGVFLRFTSGSNNNEIRWISSFTEASGVVQVNAAYSAVPAAGDTFVLLGYAGK